MKVDIGYKTSGSMSVRLETSRKKDFKWFCEIFNKLIDVFEVCPSMTSGFSCGSEDLLRIEFDVYDKKYFHFFEMLNKISDKTTDNN